MHNLLASTIAAAPRNESRTNPKTFVVVGRDPRALVGNPDDFLDSVMKIPDLAAPAVALTIDQNALRNLRRQPRPGTDHHMQVRVDQLGSLCVTRQACRIGIRSQRVAVDGGRVQFPLPGRLALMASPRRSHTALHYIRFGIWCRPPQDRHRKPLPAVSSIDYRKDADADRFR